jgi:vacuolar protein sorting-associated protein 35
MPPPQQQPEQQHHQGSVASTAAASLNKGPGSPQAQAIQSRMLTDATRKVQEHGYYMRQAMDRKDLPGVLDRAAHMVGELGGLGHGQHHHQQHSNSGGGGGDSSSGSIGPSNTGASVKLTPKNYYELYMRALEDMPQLEEYFLNLVANPHGPADEIRIVATVADTVIHRKPYTMRELYNCVQYCPRVLSRLYLQASAGSALIRSGEVGAKWVLNDLGQAVKCEQNPIRGLFLRHFLLQVLRDKLPDEPAPMAGAPHFEDKAEDKQVEGKLVEVLAVDEQEKGTVKDSYEFVMDNFMEMNKLWVRIQHLPGEGKNKDVKKRRERERNELRILVGTNLVRLSQLECVTSKIYGEIILPQILDHIVVVGDPLSQAYLMDCLVQVFPDEYHIETLPILLNVCPRLRDKVNIRTILQGLMDRLANYLAEEELLDESDTNQVKKALARDSFGLFDECVQKVYNARGPKLTSKEVVRLQTALLQFSLKCYPGNLDQISRALGVCVSALRQANVSYEIQDGTVANVPQERQIIKPLDEVAVVELEKLLSIPLDSLALKVLELSHYSELIGFLPWNNRRQVAITLLQAVDNAGSTPKSVQEIEELFGAIEPVIRDEFSVPEANVDPDVTARTAGLMAGLGVSPTTQSSFGGSFTENDPERVKEAAKLTALVSKLVHLLGHDDTDTLYEMLGVARKHIKKGDKYRSGQTLVAVVFAALRLARRVFVLEQGLKTEEIDQPCAPVEEAAEEATEDVQPPEPAADESSEEAKDDDVEASAGESKVEDQAAENTTTDDEMKTRTIRFVLDLCFVEPRHYTFNHSLLLFSNAAVAKCSYLYKKQSP